ncbi:MAG TPA: hypothetical protein VD867_07800 [Burkholderiales bacterium]|nr:hypothetical protein [Burkholderiales bacterium]
MLWTLDSLRGHSGALPSETGKTEKRDPLSVFYSRLDLMIYAAAVGLAVCLMAIFVG